MSIIHVLENIDLNNNNASDDSSAGSKSPKSYKKKALKMFSGTVSITLKWHKELNEFAYFEIFGVYVTETRNTNNECIYYLIRDKKGRILKVMYCEHNDFIPETFQKDCFLRCFGHFAQPYKFIAYRIRKTSEQEYVNASRLALISNKMISTITSSNK